MFGGEYTFATYDLFEVCTEMTAAAGKELSIIMI